MHAHVNLHVHTVFEHATSSAALSVAHHTLLDSVQASPSMHPACDTGPCGLVLAAVAATVAALQWDSSNGSDELLFSQQKVA